MFVRTIRDLKVQPQFLWKHWYIVVLNWLPKLIPSYKYKINMRGWALYTSIAINQIEWVPMWGKKKRQAIAQRRLLWILCLDCTPKLSTSGGNKGDKEKMSHHSVLLKPCCREGKKYLTTCAKPNWNSNHSFLPCMISKHII